MQGVINNLKFTDANGVTYNLYPRTLIECISNRNGDKLEDTLKQFMTDNIGEILDESLSGKVVTPEDITKITNGETIVGKAICDSEGNIIKDTYTNRTYVAEQIAGANHLTREIVQTIPTKENAEDNVIYMYKVESATGNDVYQEYQLIGGEVVLVGDTSVDLSNYVQSPELDKILNGEVSVGKAVADEDGNNIKNTYVNKNDVATSSSNGLMISTDKTFVDKLKVVDLGIMTDKTIVDLQNALLTWLGTHGNIPNATAWFNAHPNFITYWNNNDTTSLIPQGSRYTVEICGTWANTSYIQLRISTYNNKEVYFVARISNAWQKIQQVAFTDDINALDDIQTSTKSVVTQSGWYRIAEFKPSGNYIKDLINGVGSNSCKLNIRTNHADGSSERYMFDINSVARNQTITSLRSSISKNQFLKKIRYTCDSDTAYLEVYVENSTEQSYAIRCTITEANGVYYTWKTITPTLTEETVEGVTVTTTYDIPVNVNPVTNLDLDNTKTYLESLITGLINGES